MNTREYPNVKYVAAYARYSTDMQTENSIVFQMDAINRFCEEHGFKVTHRFQDEAKTGTNTNRENFQNLCMAARMHSFDAVVIYDITRGSRDVADWFNFRKAMMLLGVEVISVEDNLGDLMNPNDFLVELLGVGIGQHHVLTTRQKSIEGITARAKTGVFMGGCPPFGYDVVDQHYVINEYEASIVRKIFAMYADGQSYKAILAELKGVPTKKNGVWSTSLLSSVLGNDRYIGIYTWNRRKVKVMGKWAGGGPNERIVRIEGAIPSIIDKDTWNIVQARRKSNKRAQNSAVRREYLLSGLIECGSCGSSYVGVTSINTRGIETSYYTCSEKKRKKTCKSPNISASVLEKIISNLVHNIVETRIDDLVDAIYSKLHQTMSDYSYEQRELAEVEKKIKNATSCIMSGIIYPELREEIDSLQERKRELSRILSSNTCGNISREQIKKLVSSRISNCQSMKSLIRLFVLNIKVHQDKRIDVCLGVATFGNSESAQRLEVTTITLSAA